MRYWIPELPEDGETLLKEVKMTRPVARAFGEYWEAKGRDRALSLALWEAQAGRLRAAGSPRKSCSGTRPPASPRGSRGIMQVGRRRRTLRRSLVMGRAVGPRLHLPRGRRCNTLLLLCRHRLQTPSLRRRRGLS